MWEQIGYQQENPELRNSFLAGALELRSGIRMDSRKAETLVTFQIGFEVLPGTSPEARASTLNPYAVAKDSVFVSGE